MDFAKKKRGLQKGTGVRGIVGEAEALTSWPVAAATIMGVRRALSLQLTSTPWWMSLATN